MNGTSHSFLRKVADPQSVITPISTGVTFPESLDLAVKDYTAAIKTFQALVEKSDSSGALLKSIREPNRFDAETRMSLLKIFRRCVSLVLDTETTKKITKISTESLVKSYGGGFKNIATLKRQFESVSDGKLSALSALLAENDNRGQSGYMLTGLFFDWFESAFEKKLTIEGPRGAGRDVELRTIFPEFQESYPCDFVIRSIKNKSVLAVGFARYDATRGGSQSDDRTGGNSNKVEKAKAFCNETGKRLRIIFLADGPGMTHKDTWEEACYLDGAWNGNVRVVTLKLAESRLTSEWLHGS